MQLNIIDEKTHKVSDNLSYDVTNLDNHHIIIAVSYTHLTLPTNREV